MATLRQRIGKTLVNGGLGLLNMRPAPPQGRVINYDRSDYRRDEVSKTLTPKKARNALVAADNGDLSQAMQLFSEIEDKDPRLQSVLNTRRLALTGMEWEIVSAAEMEAGETEKTLADSAADFCRDQLTAMHEFDQALSDMALAIGPGLAVLQMVWNGPRLVAVEPVPETRAFIDFNKGKQVLVGRTRGDRVGLPARPPSFVAHMPHAKHGLSMRGSLMRSLLLIYLIRNYALKDWTVFCEVFGMPLRVARYEPTATPEEKVELLRMLSQLGTDAVGIFSRSVDLELKETGDRRGAPYSDIVEWGAREIAVAVLGQNLTTDTTGGTGTFAAADVQDRVREDLLEADMRAEATTVRRQILAPMIEYGFALSARAPVPYFRRKSRETIDHVAEADLLARAINDLNLTIPKSYAYERLGITMPEGVEGDDPVEKRQQPATPSLGSLFGGQTL